jgi:hypothetical protein
MLSEEMNFLSNINRGREEEFKTSAERLQKGRLRGHRHPAGADRVRRLELRWRRRAPDQIEQKVRLQLATQKHVPLTFTAKEKALSITDFKERFLKPAMNSLAPSCKLT